MPVKVRFAPSPTGYLHVGNVRTALVNWLYARREGGTFLLRFDDTDAARSREEYAQAIEEDLTWLGLDWDETVHQSARLDRYREIVDILKSQGRVYPCYETPEELERKRKLQLARRQPPIYDRSALALSDTERAALEAEGRVPHWRFRLDQRTESWADLIRGSVDFDVTSLSDPILIREDGTLLYTLPSVADDVDYGISHVFRGEDHVANTAVQIQIFRALNAEPPEFAHMALLTDAEGEGLSKRLGALSIRDLRMKGIEAAAITSLLARLGTADPVETHVSLENLVAGFDIARFSRAPAKFDERELENLNARILHALPFEAVRDRLGIIEADEHFWSVVQGNIAHLADAREWWHIIHDPLQPIVPEEDRDVAVAAAAALEEIAPTPENWGDITERVKSHTGRKGKALFRPLRLALTGREEGPELKEILPLIGRERAIRRLKGETA